MVLSVLHAGAGDVSVYLLRVQKTKRKKKKIKNKGLVARGSPGKGSTGTAAVLLPQLPAYGSVSSLLLLAPVVFCKGI